MAIGKRMIQRLAVAAISGWLMAPLWAQTLEVIDLQYRSAEEVLPVLQPMLEPGGALTGQDDKLFVRTSRANFEQLKAVLAQIDRAPRQMLVSVRQASRSEIEREQAAISGTISTRGGRVSAGERPPARPGVQVRAGERSATREANSISSVQVLEGNAAQIATGSSVPIVTPIVLGRDARGRVWGGAATQYRSLTSGFVVVPRINGDRVTLEIEQQDERARNGNVDAQRIATQVSGRIGEWIPLGGVSESATSSSSGILERRYTTNSDERTLWVRVDAQ